MAFDVNTMFFDTTAATTANATSAVMDFHGPDMTELAYRFVVNGTISGSSPTLTPSLETSDDNVTFSTEYTFPVISAAGETIVKYRAKKRYRRMKLATGGTNPSFGHVEAGIDSGARGKIR